MTFESLCRTFRVTPAERDELAAYLGQYRARKTYEALRPAYQGRRCFAYCGDEHCHCEANPMGLA